VTDIAVSRSPSSAFPHGWQCLASGIHSIVVPSLMAAAIPRVRAWSKPEPFVVRMNDRVSFALSTGWGFLHGQYFLPTTHSYLPAITVSECRFIECPQRQTLRSPRWVVVSSMSRWFASSGSIPISMRICSGVAIFSP